jgi:Ca2+-transporting ATPase
VPILIPNFNKIFHVSHLDLYQWGVVLLASVLMVVFVEMVKAVQRGRMNCV